MELSDWLVRYADSDVREKLRPLQLGEDAKERFYSGNCAEMMFMGRERATTSASADGIRSSGSP